MLENEKHLLLVEDELHLREVVAERLEEHGFRSNRSRAASRRWSASPNLPSTSSSPTCGCQASTAPACWKPRSRTYPEIIGIVVTGYGTVKDAVEAHQARRRRLHHETVSVRRAAARARVGAGAPPTEIGERVSADRSSRNVTGSKASSAAVPPMRDLFQLLETVAADEQHHPHHRRDRHRQGAGGARDSPQQPPARAALRGPQLQRHSGDAARSGALRPRSRRLHRRGRQHDRAGSSRRTRARCSSTKWGR